MSDIRSQVLETLRRVAARELDHRRPVEPATSLRDDLRLDSLGMIVVAVALEDRFRVKLREEDGGELATVADLCDLVARRVAERERAP